MLKSDGISAMVDLAKQVKEAASRATDGELSVYAWDATDVDNVVDAFQKLIEASSGVTGYSVIRNDADGDVVVCINGNGPTSYHNALVFAAAKANLLLLSEHVIDLAEEVRKEHELAVAAVSGIVGLKVLIESNGMSMAEQVEALQQHQTATCKIMQNCLEVDGNIEYPVEALSKLAEWSSVGATCMLAMLGAVQMLLDGFVDNSGETHS